MTPTSSPEILYEDNHLIAINKPAGLLSQRDRSDDLAAVDLVREDVRVRYAKPGNVYIALLHRLDRVTSGVLLFARTSKAAARVSAQFQAGRVAKTYYAVVEGRPDPDEGTWTDDLLKDAEHNRVRIAEKSKQHSANKSESIARTATTAYRVVRTMGPLTLLRLEPRTGRGHQLRVQLAERGMPIYGDRKYGSKHAMKAPDGGGRIALHAYALSVVHPTRGEGALEIVAPSTPGWPSAWRFATD